MPLSLEPIPPFTVRVWLAALQRPPVPYAELLESLSPDERTRADAFVFPRDRIHYVTTRGLLRAALAGVLARDAAAVALRYGAHGRPELDGAEAVVFNVSHSGDFAAIAVAVGDAARQLGVDIELERDIPDLESVARLVFTSEELRVLASAADAAARTRVFHRLWTRKEACMKATGAGFRLDPLAFQADAETAVQHVALPASSGALAGPTLTVHDLGGLLDPGYAGAVAIGAADWPLEVRRLDS